MPGSLIVSANSDPTTPSGSTSSRHDDGIDFQRAVIGDSGIGSDDPIVLDLRSTPAP